jgi:hypothetical protein
MRLKAVYCFLVLLVGCAQVPKPSMYPYTLQQHMQAAHHWQVLASQVAGELAASLKGEPGLAIDAVYIQRDESEDCEAVRGPYRTPFDQAFRGFLKTALSKQGIPISSNPDNPLRICWDVQLVVHNADRINPLSLGVLGELALSLDVWQGTEDGPLPHSEVVISTTITDNRRPIWLHNSYIFYINDQDWQHYFTPEPLVQKTYAVVDR